MTPTGPPGAVSLATRPIASTAMTHDTEMDFADFVHQGKDGHWYVCQLKDGIYHTPGKSGDWQYFGGQPDAWGWSYARRSDAINRARLVYGDA